MRPPRAIAAGALLALAWPAGGARAYVRETTDSGKPVYWAGNCASVAPDTDPPRGITLDTFTSTAAQAASNWQLLTTKAAVPCSYLVLTVDPAAAGEAHLDNKNVLKVRKDVWCRPPEIDHPRLCFSDSAASITSVFYTPATGEITDADIELNDINFTFVDLPSTVQPRPGTKTIDLENVLTHELGHFQGLDHTCWDHTAATQPKDDQGNLIPDCNDLAGLPPDEQARITSATMYNFDGPDETSKRSPEADDVAGICGIYPRAKDPGRCSSPGAPKGGCHCGAGEGAAVFGAALAWLGLRRRKGK